MYVMQIRFNGMNHHQFCVRIKFLHGNWNHFYLPLLQTPSQLNETRDHALPFYLPRCLILLCKVTWSYVIYLYNCVIRAAFLYNFHFSVHQVYGNHQLNLHLSLIVTLNILETSIHPQDSALLRLAFLALVGTVLLLTSQYIGLIDWKTLQNLFHL